MKNAISITDAENIYKALLEIVEGYGFDFDVKWGSLSKTESIGLFIMSGGVYLSKYTSGGYRAEQPVRIVYRSSPTTNNGSIDSADLLNNFVDWITKSTVTLEDNNITVDAIEKSSLVYVATQTENYTDYAVNIKIKYTCLGGKE